MNLCELDWRMVIDYMDEYQYLSHHWVNSTFYALSWCSPRSSLPFSHQLWMKLIMSINLSQDIIEIITQSAGMYLYIHSIIDWS